MSIENDAKQILNRRRQNRLYRSFDSKRVYYDAISCGDCNAIYDLSEQNYKYPTQIFEQCENYSEAMHQFYYESVCAASEMCLVAIQSGLPDMVAYDIRDEFISEFDNAVSLPDLYDLIHGMAHEFAVRVKYSKENAGYSPSLSGMMSYIEENLTSEITLQDVADSVELSRNYASTLFKKELGISMNEFILRERIAEAGRMLRAGKLTISEIAERLQFCSQSYFSKCFLKVTGKTPGEYRTNV